jgi:sortase A
MLLRVGVIMMSLAVALAAVVTLVVSLRAEHSSPTATDPPAAQTTTGDEPTAKRGITTLPVSSQDWPDPSGKEVADANGSRSFSPQHDADMTLTVPAIGLNDVPVINSNTQAALDQGVIHLPATDMPWDDAQSKNVYLAGHRLGYEGTGSRLVFYNLNKLKKGDTVTLKDSSGTAYNYRVSEVFVAESNADWAADPVRGRDIVTLQTCTMLDFRNRLIVRADRV